MKFDHKSVDKVLAGAWFGNEIPDEVRACRETLFAFMEWLLATRGEVFTVNTFAEISGKSEPVMISGTRDRPYLKAFVVDDTLEPNAVIFRNTRRPEPEYSARLVLSETVQ